MRRWLLFSLLPFITACAGGGGGAIQPSVTQGPQSEAVGPTRQALSAIGSHLLYVGNQGNNSITVYPNSASGNTAPLYVIQGSNTGLVAPQTMTGDGQGNLYVANGSNILVFANGANGNVAPIRTLLSTGVVEAMTVDQKTGKIFVMNKYDSNGNSRLLRFPPNANGYDAPFATSTPILHPAIQLTSDSTGTYIISSHAPRCCNDGFNFGTETIGKQFYNNTAPAMPYSIYGAVIGGVADDPTTKTYLAAASHGIYRFPENASGNYLQRTIMPPAVSIITSDTCNGQLAVAPGPTPNVYVSHNGTGTSDPNCTTPGVYVYANNANGYVPPLRSLSGSATLMNRPYGIYEGR